MSAPDRRTWPCNGRVAAESLRGKAAAERFVTGDRRLVTAPVADLRDAPDGKRDRQVLRGETLSVLETGADWGFVQAEKDGYVGYVDLNALGSSGMPPSAQPNAMVRARSTLSYGVPDMKTPETGRFALGARLCVTDADAKWARTDVGYVPTAHLRLLAEPEDDPVAVAERFMLMPYLWGGNGQDGIDCSGLVQAACVSCGIACPGDSDMQEKSLGRPLEAGETPARGDLMFWKGHVAWVLGPDRILHANAYHMAVMHEGLTDAIERIRDQGDGDVTSIRRI